MRFLFGIKESFALLDLDNRELKVPLQKKENLLAIKTEEKVLNPGIRKTLKKVRLPPLIGPQKPNGNY